jgi:hypothetical protein
MNKNRQKSKKLKKCQNITQQIDGLNIWTSLSGAITHKNAKVISDTSTKTDFKLQAAELKTTGTTDQQTEQQKDNN